MKQLKMLGLALLAATALSALGPGSAAATTVEVGGSAKNSAVEITASLESGTSATMKDTSGFGGGTCTGGSGTGSSESPFTGTSVSGVPGSLSGYTCTRPFTVHSPGTIKIEHIASSTNGTVSSAEAVVTVNSAIGTLKCQTGAGYHLGVLTGKASGAAVFDVNAVVNCGIVPSAKIEATIEVTSPGGLGIVS